MTSADGQNLILPRNPVIGAFFRQIDRADELGSGMRKMMKYGKKYGGTDPELIEGDIFRMVIRVPEFGKNVNPATPDIEGPVEAPVKAPVEAPVKAPVKDPLEYPVELSATETGIITALTAEALGRSALLDRLGYSQRTGNFKKAIRNLLDNSLIEMTIPGKPNSRLQKYRLTDKGRTWMRELAAKQESAP